MCGGEKSTEGKERTGKEGKGKGVDIGYCDGWKKNRDDQEESKTEAKVTGYRVRVSGRKKHRCGSNGEIFVVLPLNIEVSAKAWEGWVLLAE
jgi:hypothetical protein